MPGLPSTRAGPQSDERLRPVGVAGTARGRAAGVARRRCTAGSCREIPGNCRKASAMRAADSASAFIAERGL